MWDVAKAVKYINDNAEPGTTGYCARYVKKAISAGGDISAWPSIQGAKDYGSALLERGFQVIPGSSEFIAGDVVVIQGIRKSDFPVGVIQRDHPYGHMAMFNGQQWVSDFKQNNGYYPGNDYLKAQPACVFYRHKDVSGNEGAGTTRSTDSKRICFPARKADGKDYTTLEEMMDLVGREPHGSWLAGTNHLWHGGIHIGTVSAPGSILTADTVETAVPLQCMVNGEVVAWRLNKDYKTAAYGDKTLRYSSTFVLVKSVFKPDPKEEKSWLEFYSLYMGLAPLSAFPKGKCFKAKTTVSQRKAGKFENSASSDGVSAAPAKCGQIKKDQRVIVLQEKQFRNGGDVQPFGLAKKLNGKGNVEGEAFWVTVMSEYMEPDGEQYLQMPVWMQKAVAHGEFDEVVKPPTTVVMEAGEAIGFLGEDIAPAGKGNVDCCHYAHIEVISMDPRMPDFLNNPANVTTGQKYIQILSGKSLYQKTGKGEESKFEAMSCIVLKDGGKLLPWEKCNPLVDKAGKTWFEVRPHSWMSQDDVKQVHQYDLTERGFSTLEEKPSPDVSKSLRENWVKGAYDWLSEQVGKERGIQQKQVSAFYKNMVKKIDADGDGELSGKELYNALHHPELGLRDIAARLVVKHDSEWFGGSKHHRWSVFFQNYDRLRVDYAKQWIDDCEWMSKVPPFNKGEPIWHFHPVMFLDALKHGGIVSLEEARVRALMRVIRFCEGTTSEEGYEHLFGGESFIRDYHKTYSDHPQVIITKKNKKTKKEYSSSASGAYQILGWVWSSAQMVSFRKEFNISDFSPISQDKMCVVILQKKVKGNALDLIVNGKISQAITDGCSYEWASLPPGRHGQPIKSLKECLDQYELFLKEELSGKSNLYINYGFLKEFGYE